MSRDWWKCKLFPSDLVFKLGQLIISLMIYLLNMVHAATNPLEFMVFSLRGLSILEPTPPNRQVRYYVLAIFTID
jgi:hypothetical protein